MFAKASALCGLLLLSVSYAATYAVIVAGSEGYSNYRHQADAGHWTHILHQNGVPNKNIILFMEDDVAYNTRNIYRGKLFNNPKFDTNVYPPTDFGMAITFRQQDASAENILKILSGQTVKGVSLPSTEKDTVLFLYSDHGSSGLICSPHGYIYANALHQALETGFANKKWGKFIAYVEACYSGSMFKGWEDKLKAINGFATTAANDRESSYGAYCRNTLGTCLGDEYSVAAMEMLDSGAYVKSKTLAQHAADITAKTTGSHVMTFGSPQVGATPLSKIFTASNDNEYVPSNMHVTEMIPVVDMDLQLAARFGDDSLVEAIATDRKFWDSVFESATSGLNLATYTGGSLPFDDEVYACYSAGVETVEKACGAFSDYAISRLGSIGMACAEGLGDEYVAAVTRECANRM